MSDISKTFPGVLAVSGVNLEILSGEIHAIVGENGAGKSTLMKILAGVYKPTSGTISWKGQTVSLASPQAGQQLGIRMVFQELSLVPDLTVAENISLGRMPKNGLFLDRKQMIRHAVEALATIGEDLDPNALIADLTISQRQLVEIARVISSGAELVALDEPTSSLTEHEAQKLLTIIRALKEKGISVIYISHRLHEVLEIADRVTVMRDGKSIDCRPATETSPSELVRVMVGRDLEDVFPKTVVEIGDVVFQAKSLTSAGRFSDISVEVRSGEIVGLAGLVGAGRTEFARAVFGLDHFDSGSCQINGIDVRPRNPAQAIRLGIAYLPEDRRLLGIVPPLTIRENLTLSSLRKVSRAGLIKRRAESVEGTQLAEYMTVSPPAIESRIDTLSGGNQQKVVLGRWLATNPSLLILDEPTRGVDVGAKAEIHRIIGKLASEGMAILMISSELPEIIAASDRVYVLHEGAISAELSREEATEENIMVAATGAAVN
ncbi:sugar ABC transporter ATP-binding protein [Salinibacterium sp. TMP30]|uniref:sugar ABC transporter ATP-binding protein n=1 Tax=Salinibacterium sp. TMP30 TaxID=3138237 RepID=UPI0031389D31